MKGWIAVVVGGALCVAGCAVGPNYRRPVVQVPTGFKEAADWRRARPDPQAALSSTWWLAYRDDALSHLVDRALKANQSIVVAEAAYRLARATVTADTAKLYPTVTANLALTHVAGGANVPVTGTTIARGGAINIYNANGAVSWQPDLWGQIRRQIESSKESAQATDAQLAGERLSIVASVAIDYFELRQADIDIDLLKQQQKIDAVLLDATRAAYGQGTASNNNVLTAQDTLETVVADLQTTLTAREQDEHAIAVLIGVPPADFSLAPLPDYVFSTPPAPLVLPSQLLERRPDVVVAERTAAAANAKIGVAVAAFYPALNLSVEGGFESSTLGQLFKLPSQFWTLGPSLSETIFDGGARTAAVREARATYDEDVATYRGTVLTAFQDVENSLSSYNHLQQQARAFADIQDRNQQLFSAQHQAVLVGSASGANELTQQLTLLQAEQNLKDTQSLLAQSSVTLVENLGGGWQSGDLKGVAASGAPPAGASHPSAQAGVAPP
ncbi:MAG TPA: efflux transporter outer membrane subunit [Caulobacteraceae bacterium]|nr:efflux transporter outer membrane subunit [Caulobacteraceae bacterium]